MKYVQEQNYKITKHTYDKSFTYVFWFLFHDGEVTNASSNAHHPLKFDIIHNDVLFTHFKIIVIITF